MSTVPSREAHSLSSPSRTTPQVWPDAACPSRGPLSCTPSLSCRRLSQSSGACPVATFEPSRASHGRAPFLRVLARARGGRRGSGLGGGGSGGPRGARPPWPRAVQGSLPRCGCWGDAGARLPAAAPGALSSVRGAPKGGQQCGRAGGADCGRMPVRLLPRCQTPLQRGQVPGARRSPLH